MRKLYKGEIGRWEFFKYLMACCIVNWILSTIVTIMATIFTPFLTILYAPSLLIWILILFNYKKRGMNIFKNEIVSWIIAIYATLFGICYGIWQLATCIYLNMLETNKINEITLFTQNQNIAVYFGYIGLPLTIILLIYLFIPGRKTK